MEIYAIALHTLPCLSVRTRKFQRHAPFLYTAFACTQIKSDHRGLVNSDET